MSALSKSSSKKKAIDAPFEKKLKKRAEEIAQKYRVMIEEEDGHYYGCAVEMPYCMGGGPTVDACFESTMQGIIAGVATMLENGEEPPLALGENRRTEQVNVRISFMEKFWLEEAARQQGFRGVSDFVRNASLTAARSQGVGKPAKPRVRKTSGRKAAKS